MPSRIANWLISRVTGVHLQDYGCTLKAYRREVLTGVKLYGEMHRFIPAYAKNMGARISEIPVRHHPRTRGTSKYGIGRTLKVLLDLLTVKFLGSYATKPIYVFGGLGLISFLLAFAIGAFVVVRRIFFEGQWISPMILLMAIFAIMAAQFILMGLIAELLMRTYHESQNKVPYVISRTVNL